MVLSEISLKGCLIGKSNHSFVNSLKIFLEYLEYFQQVNTSVNYF